MRLTGLIFLIGPNPKNKTTHLSAHSTPLPCPISFITGSIGGMLGGGEGSTMKAKKRFGQHFLVNKGVITRILDAIEPDSDHHYLEIGPGPGTLTTPFNQRGFGLTAVEYDQDMVDHLATLPFDPAITVIQGDFMDVPLADVITPQTKVFSNLPYNVSVPITARLLEASPHIPLMVMMYQKEVAERIRAAAGSRDYGPISVLARAFYDIDLHFNVAPGSFRPPPKVLSQVLRFRRKPTPLLEIADLARVTTLVRHVFNHRRKTLGSNLRRWNHDWTNAATLIESLSACGLDSKLRPEQLEPEDYFRWYRQIRK